MHYKKLVHTVLILILTFLLVHDINAQRTSFDKLLRKKLSDANYYYKFGDFDIALAIFKDLYELDSLNTEVNYKLGVCIYNTYRDKTKAITYFEEVKDGINEKWGVGADHIDTYYYLGRLYHLKMLFDKSINYFQDYKNSKWERTFSNEEVDFYIEKVNVAKQLMAVPVEVDIMNMGNVINSPYPDYVPIISSEESVLLFTSRRKGSTGGLIDQNKEFFEDIYISYKDDKQWTEPEKLGSPINTPTHDACVSMSADGHKLFIYRTNKELTGGDIYVSELIDEKWSTPKKVGSKVNSKNALEASASLSPNENILYFSSNRKGGYGGMDIYKVIKLPNGKWGLAQNLGTTINSPYDEDAPFIHPDGRTLYFSSKGHKNMGGYDIFRSTLTEDGKWSEPENLGYPINTVNSDIYLVVSVDGKRGYYSSNRKGGVGYSDIYTINMFENQINFIVLKGEIITSDSLIPLKATITLIDEQTKKIQGIYRTHKETGRYVLVVLSEKKYKIIVEVEGFHNYFGELEVSDDKEDQTQYLEIKLDRE